MESPVPTRGVLAIQSGPRTVAKALFLFRERKGTFCLFVCLFVVIKSENPYFVSRSGLEVNPLGVFPLGPRSWKLLLRSYQRYTAAQNHSTCQLRLRLYKLTGWLASLDYASPTLKHSHPPNSVLRLPTSDPREH